MAEDNARVPNISVSRTSTATQESKASKEEAQPCASHGKKFAQWHSQASYNTPVDSSPHWKFSKYDGGWKGAQSPGWKIKWDGKCFQRGRVLIIDYISSDNSTTPDGKRHIRVQAQEIQNIEGLRHFYSDPRRVHCAALRVIHVQNAPWATLFLLNKFNINHPSEVVGMRGFSKWAQYEKPRQRNGKPAPSSRSWRGQTDPWRNIARTAFGLDYLKASETEAPSKRGPRRTSSAQPVDAKFMHLNAYEDSHSPHGYDVSVQRLSVYIQRDLGPEMQDLGPDFAVKNPYLKHFPNGTASGDSGTEKSLLRYLDNGNTVIVFETSASLQLDDCLIQPRNDIENRWRRLSFYLKKEDVSNDHRLAAQCGNIILSDVFHGLGNVWDHFLGCASDHVAILEDKIYENPADESRAPELWTNQALWLKVEKILLIHSDLVRDMQGHMREIAEADEDEGAMDVDWLANTPAEYDRLTHTVTEDLVQPTNNLSDLMYKSVGIRDSRQSLQLGLSMWRLSWITFIFLPLTFCVSFFGMNVDILASNPNVGWFFLAAVILMIFVLILWYCVKHSLQRSRQTPYQRGLYETLFTNLEDQYPDLWASTAGALPSIHPTTISDRIKWNLLRRWFSPEKTINRKLYSRLAPDGDAAELGAWASFKCQPLLRWLPQITENAAAADNDLRYGQDPIALAEMGSTSRSSVDNTHYEVNAIAALAKPSTPVAVASVEPIAASASASVPLHGLRPLHIYERRASGSSRHSDDRPSSRGSSGIMIEERNLSDSESDVGDNGTPTPNMQIGSSQVT